MGHFNQRRSFSILKLGGHRPGNVRIWVDDDLSREVDDVLPCCNESTQAVKRIQSARK